MENYRRPLILILVLIVVIGGGGWYILTRQSTDNGPLQASGTVEAVEVIVAPEAAGRVVQVLVDEGDRVQAGAALFVLDDETLQAQRRRALSVLETARAQVQAAQATLENARAALATANAGVEIARAQLDLELSLARREELPARATAWQADLPDQFTLPVWYFQKEEQISAAQEELNLAEQAYHLEQENFQRALASASNADLMAVEERLARAQAAFLIAETVLDRGQAQRDPTLEDYAQTVYDTAQAELEAAQLAYDQVLSEQASADLLEARARLAVARKRYEVAQDRYQSLLTGADSLRVKAARAALEQAQAAAVQAEKGVAQAEANLALAQKAVDQAQAELDLIDIQIARLTVRAAVDGVVLTRNIEPGEVIQPGGKAMTLGQLDQLHITVYIPEDRYGQVQLGDPARVTVDSFPGQTFHARVVRIADQAEFTPRNVQTAEGRRTTVFAVELAVEDPQGLLKPGMPADVTFE